jgi:CRP-like cAMP-binding protein
LNIIEELRGSLLLSRLSDGQLERVQRHATCLRLHDGQMLFNQGDPAQHFYLVKSGRLRLFRLSIDGAEKVIEIIGPGETFAEALMFLDAARYPVCAMALEPVELIAIETRDFALMLRESVDTCFLIMGVLSQRLHGLVQEIENLTLHSASSRFACYLLSRLPPYKMAVELDLRKGIIASRLSIKPETLSRIERELSMRGIIAVRGSRIHVLNLKRLEEIAALGDRVNPAILINGKGVLT